MSFLLVIRKLYKKRHQFERSYLKIDTLNRFKLQTEVAMTILNQAFKSIHGELQLGKKENFYIFMPPSFGYPLIIHAKR